MTIVTTTGSSKESCLRLDPHYPNCQPQAHPCAWAWTSTDKLHFRCLLVHSCRWIQSRSIDCYQEKTQWSERFPGISFNIIYYGSRWYRIPRRSPSELRSQYCLCPHSLHNPWPIRRKFCTQHDICISPPPLNRTSLCVCESQFPYPERVVTISGLMWLLKIFHFERAHRLLLSQEVGH